SGRHAEDGGCADGWMRQQGILHFGRRDVLATPPDHLLEPPGQEDVAVLITVAGITRVQPAVLNGRRRDLGRIPVPRRHHGIAEAELTDLAGFHVATFRVNYAQLVLEGTRRGVARTSNTAGFHARGRALGTAERILTHAVPGQDANAEARLELIALRRRRSGRGVERAARRFHHGA